MVTQQLQMVKALLENSPPNVEAALRELDIAMAVAMQEYEKYSKLKRQLENEPEPVPFDFDNWKVPERTDDALLKEFGW
jgi:hypothetical protein